MVPPNEDAARFLEANVVSNMGLLALENDLNKVVSVAQASARLLSTSGTMGTQEANIISSIAGNASKASTPSLEAVDQLSNTLRYSVGLVNERDLQSEARGVLTESLERQLQKVNEFALKGQLAGRRSLDSLLFLIQNNIASETGRFESGRKRRSVAQGTSSQVKKNLNLAMQLYSSILRASIAGEKASVLSNEYGHVVLRRDRADLLNTTFSASGCSFAMNRTLGPFGDVFQIFNVSYSDPFTRPSPIVSKIAGLSFASPNGSEIAVKDLPENETILIRLDRGVSRQTILQNEEIKTVAAKKSIEGELMINEIDTNKTALVIEIVPKNGHIRNIQAYIRPGTKPVGDEVIFRFQNSTQGTLVKHFQPGFV